VECLLNSDCDDGLFCNGIETCVSGSCMDGTYPCTGQICVEDGDTCVDCLVDADCPDDSIFCIGVETCASGSCVLTDPCPGQFCVEDGDACVDCLVDTDCPDDGLFCTGVETCVGGSCVPGTDPCPGQSCDENTDACVSGGKMETKLITSVGTDWVVVSLAGSGFTYPVPVCTAHYVGSLLSPAVVRMRDVTAGSFEIKLQNPGNSSPLSDLDVHCLVVEKGSWLMPNGQPIEARTYASSVTDRKKSWNGELQPILSSFISPVVVGQVMSSNDPEWSVFWSRGSSRTTPPTSTDFFAGKHVAEDTSTSRVDETVGYIVFDVDHNTAGGIEYEAGITGDVVRGYGNSPTYSVNYNQAFSNPPPVAIVSQVAMDGNDGGWAVLSGTQTSSALSLVIDEDQIAGDERRHTTEQVAYIAFGAQGSITLT